MVYDATPWRDVSFGTDVLLWRLLREKKRGDKTINFAAGVRLRLFSPSLYLHPYLHLHQFLVRAERDEDEDKDKDEEGITTETQ